MQELRFLLVILMMGISYESYSAGYTSKIVKYEPIMAKAKLNIEIKNKISNSNLKSSIVSAIAKNIKDVFPNLVTARPDILVNIKVEKFTTTVPKGQFPHYLASGCSVAGALTGCSAGILLIGGFPLGIFLSLVGGMIPQILVNVTMHSTVIYDAIVSVDITDKQENTIWQDRQSLKVSKKIGGALLSDPNKFAKDVLMAGIEKIKKHINRDRDIIERKIEEKPEPLATITKAKKTIYKDNLAPEITILSPSQQRGIAVVSESYASIIGIARDQSKIITVIVGDKEATTERIMGGVKFEAKVPLEENENRIVIKAFDEYGNIGKKVVNIHREKQITATKSPIIFNKPDLWILSVGISRYENPSMNLMYADNDAKKIATLFTNQKNKLFNQIHYRILTNENATRINIIDRMESFLGQASYNDVILIFIAGHGIKRKQTGSYYFLTYNANPDNLLANGLQFSDFNEAIKTLKQNVSKIILIFDTCHAGAMQVAMRGAEAGEDLAQALREAEGVFYLSASKPGEESIEGADYKLNDETKGHGVFTYAIINGLMGAADFDGSGDITITELFSYVAKSVPRITRGKQHPYFEASGVDIPIWKR